MRHWSGWAMAVAMGLPGCRESGPRAPSTGSQPAAPASSSIESKVAQYASVRLTSDLSGLTDKERRMLPLLIDAASTMDTIFRRQHRATGNVPENCIRLREMPVGRDFK